MFTKKNFKYLIAFILMMTITQLSLVTEARNTEAAEAQVVMLQTNLEQANHQIASLVTQVNRLQEIVDTTHVTTNRIHIYEGDSTSSPIVGIYEKGTAIVAEPFGDKWYRTEHGYVYKGYIKPVIGQKAKVTEYVEPKPEPSPVVAKTMSAPPAPPAPKEYKVGVTGKSGLSEADIKYLVKGYPVEKGATKILELESKYNVNAFFTLAVAKQETTWGKHGVGTRGNLFGLTGPAKSSMSGYINYFGDVINRLYVAKGKDTVKEIHYTYCPTDDEWGPNVEMFMKQLHSKIINR